MGMIPGTEIPPNGVKPETWAEVNSAVEKLKAVHGMEAGYPMIVYRDSSGIYVNAGSTCYRVISARLEVETIEGGKNRLTLSFPR